MLKTCQTVVYLALVYWFWATSDTATKITFISFSCVATWIWSPTVKLTPRVFSAVSCRTDHIAATNYNVIYPALATTYGWLVSYYPDRLLLSAITVYWLVSQFEKTGTFPLNVTVFKVYRCARLSRLETAERFWLVENNSVTHWHLYNSARQPGIPNAQLHLTTRMSSFLLTLAVSLAVYAALTSAAPQSIRPTDGGLLIFKHWFIQFYIQKFNILCRLLSNMTASMWRKCSIAVRTYSSDLLSTLNWFTYLFDWRRTQEYLNSYDTHLKTTSKKREPDSNTQPDLAGTWSYLLSARADPGEIRRAG